jgi:hypothetical protein
MLKLFNSLFFTSIILVDSNSQWRTDIDWPEFLYRKPNIFHLQNLLHENKPRLHCSELNYLIITIEISLLHLETTHQLYSLAYQYYLNEKTFLGLFNSLKVKYEKFLVLFLNDLQFTRKQRAIELDLNLRKERLVSLRDVRFQSIQDVKLNDLRQDEIDRQVKEEMEKNKVPALLKAAKQAKQLIRNVNDKVREMRYAQDTAMNEEEMKIANRIKEKNKDGLGNRPQAIKSLALTSGTKELEYFEKQNAHLKSRGLPYYERMEKSLGNQVYLWSQLTYESNDFLTDIVLSSKDSDSEYYKDILQLNHKKRDKFDSITSEDLTMFIYFKKSSHSQGIKKIELSFTEEEESRLIVEGYTKIEPNLSVFGMPEVNLWLEMVSKKAKNEKTSTDALITEIRKVRELLSERPADKNLKELLIRLNEKLKVAYETEMNNEVANPLAVAIDLMSLNEVDMDIWMTIFEKVDVEKRGKVNMEEIYNFFEVIPTDFTKEIFVSVDAIDDIGLIEFGDFMRAIGTYCFFGKEEIVKFIYVFIDRERKGYILFSTFNDFIEKLHPYEKLRARRAIKQMQLHPKKLKMDSKISYEDLRKYNNEFPALFFPAFAWQDTLRNKTLGVDWWFEKLTLYSQVRKKILKAGQNAEEVIELEIDRFKEEENRKDRIAKRAVDIKNEGSEIRRAILKAKQFLDEVS